ncbi:hypothetical protein [Psychroserpens ponticola]|uniref:Uncharacterized protein n=1 Tax=Psychroserpens ponticola TaxID=2932268 RepID=A0ABY7S277_9FLAO|nr:hypothetical protein [Psychroserpens ponticola]WCO02010.1 hypothetical protein MUN68_000620 [Psychroserpens ponticola]
MKVRVFIGILFLLLQVGSMTYARFIPERFFCWAPYDTHVKFEVFVTIDGNTLNPEDTEARYKYKMKGWEQRSIDNIFSLISQYERTYGKVDNAKVLMTYSINGHEEQEWRFEHE